jgi:16S rRNA processing protein RimM
VAAARSDEKPELAVGRIAAPHGVNGRVRVQPLTDVPQRFAKLREVCLELADGERRQVTIESASVGPRFVLVKLKGYDDRDAAGALRGAYILIPRAEAIALPQGRYFIDDIVGLEVVTVQGERLGPVREVMQTGANDVYVTETAMIPATREVVREINLEAGVMTVDLPGEI